MAADGEMEMVKVGGKAVSHAASYPIYWSGCRRVAVVVKQGLCRERLYMRQRCCMSVVECGGGVWRWSVVMECGDGVW